MNECFFHIVGYILVIDEDSVTVSVSHKITPYPNRKNIIYRIDLDHTLSSFSTPLTNLSKLFLKDSPQDEKIRELVIGNMKPSFNSLTKLDDSIIEMMSELNIAQQKAINRCICTKDYLMILGKFVYFRFLRVWRTFVKKCYLEFKYYVI